MSEEQKAVETEKPPEKEPAKVESNDDKPVGYAIVDPATDPPEKVQERIDYLYKNLKKNEGLAKQAVTDAQVMANRVHELEAKVGQKDIDEATAAIKRQIAEATERGDGAKTAELVEQLLHVKQPVEKPVAKPAETPVHDPEVASLRAWADELNDGGIPKRPWTQEGHPYQMVAANVGAAVMDHPNWAHRPLNDRLQEIERRMNAEMGSPSAPAVLDGGQPPPRRGEKVELTNDQKRVAWNMKPNLSQAEAETWYAKALKGAK